MSASVRTHCRACGSPYLLSILDLGELVVSDFVRPGTPDPPKLPLELVICDRCDLAQLRHTTDPTLLYRKYWYRSGINETMRAELEDIVTEAIQVVGGLLRSDNVLDIGANDGTLLRAYHHRAFAIAYEPAWNLYEELRPHADALVPSFFPDDLDSAIALKRDVKIVTSIAMFNHVDDPRRFVEAIDQLLGPDGVWVMQVQDLAQQVQRTAYDNINFEHLTYYTVKTFEALLAAYDLCLYRAEPRAINGGSIRFYVRRRKYGQTFTDNLERMRTAEAWLTREALARSTQRIADHKAQLVGTIDHFLQFGPVDLYAASTKSSTLLQHCGIDHHRIRRAVERTPDKWGLETSGTRIPIVSEASWRMDPAPVCVLGAWQFRDAFLQREAEYLASGGRFICPLPQVELIEQVAEAVT